MNNEEIDLEVMIYNALIMMRFINLHTNIYT
jgi:hypothetical protein